MPNEAALGRMRRACCLLAAAALAIAPAPAQRDKDQESRDANAPFSIGVLRRDGIVVPFASYDGRRWQPSWPADLKLRELPISLDSVDEKWWGRAKPPRSMTLWTNGTPRGTLKLVTPAVVPVPCERRLGIRTSYFPAEPSPSLGAQPFPKDGLVVSGPQKVDAIEIVPADAPERAEVAQAIAEEFDDEENAAAAGFISWRHPLKRSERRKIPIQVEALYRAPIDEEGWTAYYVEAVRSYPPGENDDDDCGLVTMVRGWVRTGPGGKQRVSIGAQITYCDRYGVPYMLPLGLMKLGSGTYWVYQIAGYERESYLIARPRASTIERILSYPAVVCPFQ